MLLKRGTMEAVGTALPRGSTMPSQDVYTSPYNWPKNNGTQVTFCRYTVNDRDSTVNAEFYFPAGFTLEAQLPEGEVIEYSYIHDFTISATYPDECQDKYKVSRTTHIQLVSGGNHVTRIIKHLQNHSIVSDIELELNQTKQVASQPLYECQYLMDVNAPTGVFCCTSMIIRDGGQHRQGYGRYWVKYDQDSQKITEFIGNHILPPLSRWLISLGIIGAAHLLMIFHIWQYVNGELVAMLYQERYDLVLGFILPLWMIFMYCWFPNKWMLNSSFCVTFVKSVTYLGIAFHTLFFIQDTGAYVAWYVYHAYVVEFLPEAVLRLLGD